MAPEGPFSPPTQAMGMPCAPRYFRPARALRLRPLKGTCPAAPFCLPAKPIGYCRPPGQPRRPLPALCSADSRGTLDRPPPVHRRDHFVGNRRQRAGRNAHLAQPLDRFGNITRTQPKAVRPYHLSPRFSGDNGLSSGGTKGPKLPGRPFALLLALPLRRPAMPACFAPCKWAPRPPSKAGPKKCFGKGAKTPFLPFSGLPAHTPSVAPALERPKSKPFCPPSLPCP